MGAPPPRPGQVPRSPTPAVDLVGESTPDPSREPQVGRPAGSEPWQFNQPVLLRRSPRASSVLVWTFVGGSALLLVWALVAPLAETVAVQGKLQPGSRVKQVEAPVAGVVAEIFVKEGEPVRQGQLLVRFDLRDARSRLVAAEAIRARLASENRIYAAALGDRATSRLTLNQKLQLQNQRADLQGRLRAAQQELRQSQQRLAGLRQSWATSHDIANRYQALAQAGAVSGVQALQTRDAANQLLSRLLEERRVEARLQAALIQAQAGPAADLRGRIEANLRQMSELEGQIRQARLQIQYGQLTAPSSGVVFDLLVNPGSVVPTSGVLMAVVPGDSLDARVLVPSRVIGFVLPGQTANISIDTFPSTDYGRVPAVVRSIGSDALTSQEMKSSLGAEASGLFYPVVLQLQRQHLQARSRVIPLKAGMTLTADIRLRERPFISVLTSFFEDKLRSLERLR